MDFRSSTIVIMETQSPRTANRRISPKVVRLLAMKPPRLLALRRTLSLPSRHLMAASLPVARKLRRAVILTAAVKVFILHLSHLIPTRVPSHVLKARVLQNRHTRVPRLGHQATPSRQHTPAPKLVPTAILILHPPFTRVPSHVLKARVLQSRHTQVPRLGHQATLIPSRQNTRVPKHVPKATLIPHPPSPTRVRSHVLKAKLLLPRPATEDLITLPTTPTNTKTAMTTITVITAPITVIIVLLRRPPSVQAPVLARPQKSISRARRTRASFTTPRRCCLLLNPSPPLINAHKSVGIALFQLFWISFLVAE